MTVSGYGYGFRGKTQASLIISFKSIWEGLSGVDRELIFLILDTENTVISNTIKMVPWRLRMLEIHGYGVYDDRCV